jgi:hypothetical protein
VAALVERTGNTTTPLAEALLNQAVYEHLRLVVGATSLK